MQSGSDWAGGYITEVEYTGGYFPALNPVQSQLALLLAGITPPKFETACELGFGQGVSLAVHAHASDTQWFGCDVNPSHVAHARNLMRGSNLESHLFAEGFEDFCARSDLPEFDFIALHGVWAWVDEKYRSILADFFTRKLRVGGVLYISYNTLPGWAPFEPIRQIIAQYVHSQAAPGSSLLSRLDAALDHIASLIEADAGFIKANPGVKAKFEQIRKQDRRYLVHEYCNRHWTPLHFADVSRRLLSARLSYVGSVDPLDHIDTMNFSPRQSEMLRATEDWQYRETLRDMFLNQKFRRDLWIKGPTRLERSSAHTKLKALPIVVQRTSGSLSLKARVGRGEITLKSDPYEPLAAFIAHEGETTIGAVLAEAQKRGVSNEAALEAITVLASNQSIALGQSASAQAQSRAHNYNAKLACETAYASKETTLHFASPATGGGVALSRIDAFALGAALLGARGQQRIDAINSLLAQHGQKLSVDGGALNERQIAGDLLRRSDALLPALERLNIFASNLRSDDAVVASAA